MARTTRIRPRPMLRETRNRSHHGTSRKNRHMVVQEKIDMIDPEIVRQVDAWLDNNTGLDYQYYPLAQHWGRVAKITEEAGEAIAELILWTGQNPRKPIDATAYERMLQELGDVATTAIYAIQHFTKDITETQA